MITIPRLRRSRGLHAADPLAPRQERSPVPEVAHEEPYEIPHGIATPETLMEIVIQAQAEAAGILTEPWDKPDDLYPSEQDVRSPRTRGYVPQPDAPVRWYAFLSPEEAADRVRRITYPPPGSSGVQYAAVMWQFSAATGTTSRFERPATWPRHGIEAGAEAAA